MWPTETTIKGGLSELDIKALAVIACRRSPLPADITTTPVAKRPSAPEAALVEAAERRVRHVG
jgi:hypothetical protein